jgi:hypothetical protein
VIAHLIFQGECRFISPFLASSIPAAFPRSTLCRRSTRAQFAFFTILLHVWFSIKSSCIVMSGLG